jgi:two-component system sensor kinase FixL
MSHDVGVAVERRPFDRSPLIVCNLEGRIRVWGQGMERLTGYRRDEAVGQRLDALLDTTYPEAGREPPEANGQGRWSGRLGWRRRDGARVTVDAERLLLRSDDGAPDGTPAFSIVIVRGGRAEELSTLASIVNNSDDAIIGKSPTGVVTSWNRGAELMFGYTAEEMIGQTLERLFPPGTFAEEAEILARLGRGEHIDHSETVRVRKDSRLIDVSISVSPIRDGNGRIVGASKIARDITEQKTARAKLSELQSELFHMSRLNDMGQLAAAFAHELNQPLSAISAYIGGARRLIEDGDTARALEGCDRAAAQVARAGQVIRRIRDFVRKGDDRTGEEDLAQAIEEAVALVRIDTRWDGLTIDVKLDEDARVALIDRVQIQQVIVNLVRNAAEAMSQTEAKQISITTRRLNPEKLEIRVADSGPGISDDALARLFHPFNTTKSTGMGVGLSLCRGIVESHGGAISAENAPSGGAVFGFTVPAVRRKRGGSTGKSLGSDT